MLIMLRQFCAQMKTADPVTFFAFEWENPRFGKVIKEINLKPVNFMGNNENAIILIGIPLLKIRRSGNGKRRLKDN